MHLAWFTSPVNAGLSSMELPGLQPALGDGDEHNLSHGSRLQPAQHPHPLMLCVLLGEQFIP